MSASREELSAPVFGYQGLALIGLLPAVLLASLGTRLFEHQLPGLLPNGITMWVVAPPISRRTSWRGSFLRAARRASIRT